MNPPNRAQRGEINSKGGLAAARVHTRRCVFESARVHRVRGIRPSLHRRVYIRPLLPVTFSPSVANNDAGVYTFRILAIGGIAFNLGSRRPQETTNILFKHLTNTRRGPGSFRPSALSETTLSLRQTRRNRDETGAP